MSNRARTGFAPRPPVELPELSVIISTYDRCAGLERAVRSVLAQRSANTPAFELIVVDNNSKDATAEAVNRFAGEDDRVRYVFESRQGLSHARNSGIAAARAPLVAFTDDDVRAEPDWISSIVRAFAEHPAVDVVGGRVLPIWPATPPDWLTREHWTPLALVDHGDRPFIITGDRPMCLVGANLACRRAVFDRVGVFATEFQRVKDGIGSLEDHDFQLRLLRAGGKALYDPRITMFAEVQPNRLQPAYHRRWHAGHGHFYALLRAEEVEQTGVGTLFGVPAHLYRQALSDVIGWVRASLLGRPTQAFRHEVGLHFFGGFLRTRRRERLARPRDQRRMWHPVGVASGERLDARSTPTIDPGRR